MTASPVPILLITHPGLAEGFRRAAEAVVGDLQGLEILTNEGLSPEVLCERVAAWLDAHPGPALILSDLGFGSCCASARRVAAARDDVAVLSGVNAPMLFAALRPRAFAEFDAYVEHVAARGREGIDVFRAGRRA